MTTTLYRMPVRASMSARMDGVSVCVSRPALTARPTREPCEVRIKNRMSLSASIPLAAFAGKTNDHVVLIRLSVNRNRAKDGAVNLHRDLLIRLPLQHAAGRRLAVAIILIHERSSLPIRIGTRRRPQLPGCASNKPGIAVEQMPQRPSAVSCQVVMSYQSRPMIRSLQPGQYVLW